MKVSILLPARNEKDGIVETIKSIPIDVLNSQCYDVEVLVVDNDSVTNLTKNNAEKYGARVIYENKKGYGNACKTGFRFAEGDIIIISDADNTYPMNVVPDLLKVMQDNNLEFISTNRLNLSRIGVMGTRNKIGNMMISFFVKLLFHININDSESGMIAIKKECLDDLIFKDMGFAFCRELKIEACYYRKCKWKEVDIDYHHRIGNTKMKAWKVGLGAIVHIIGKKINRG